MASIRCCRGRARGRGCVPGRADDCYDSNLILAPEDNVDEALAKMAADIETENAYSYNRHLRSATGVCDP